MREKTRTAAQPDATPADVAGVGRYRALARPRATLAAAIGWLRAGYPDDAPRLGYSPLLALNGPVALTPRQAERVATGLIGGAGETIDIAVAITMATDRLPTQPQIRAITYALHQQTRE